MSGNPGGQGLVGRILGGIPREFFVETDVLAMPSDLGHQVGAAVLRDQDLLILSALLAGQQAMEVSSAELPARVREHAESLTDPVLIYNGQSDVENLLGLEFSDIGAVTLAGYEAFALYVGDTAFPGEVVVVDRAGIPGFSFEAKEKDPLTALHEVALSVGILELSDDAQDHPTVTIEYGQVVRWSDEPPAAIQVRVIRPDGSGDAAAQ